MNINKCSKKLEFYLPFLTFSFYNFFITFIRFEYHFYILLASPLGTRFPFSSRDVPIPIFESIPIPIPIPEIWFESIPIPIPIPEIWFESIPILIPEIRFESIPIPYRYRYQEFESIYRYSDTDTLAHLYILVGSTIWICPCIGFIIHFMYYWI